MSFVLWSAGEQVRSLRGEPYKFIGFGDIYGPEPYKFAGFGGIYGPDPYKSIGCPPAWGDRGAGAPHNQAGVWGWQPPWRGEMKQINKSIGLYISSLTKLCLKGSYFVSKVSGNVHQPGLSSQTRLPPFPQSKAKQIKAKWAQPGL